MASCYLSVGECGSLKQRAPFVVQRNLWSLVPLLGIQAMHRRPSQHWTILAYHQGAVTKTTFIRRQTESLSYTLLVHAVDLCVGSAWKCGRSTEAAHSNDKPVAQ